MITEDLANGYFITVFALLLADESDVGFSLGVILRNQPLACHYYAVGTYRSLPLATRGTA